MDIPPKTAMREALTQNDQQRKSLRQENMAPTAQKREHRLNELEQRFYIKSSPKAQAKKKQSNEKQIGEQALWFYNLEDKVAAIQYKVKRSAEEARKKAERTVETPREEIETFQNNLIRALRSELTTRNEKDRE